MRIVKAFQCEYCHRKVGMNKTHIGNHEKVCFHNPKRRACQTCEHNVGMSETIYNPHHGGNPGSTDYEDVYRYCEKKEKPIRKLTFSQKNECRMYNPKDDK